MHFVSHLALISITLSLAYAASLDFTSFHIDLSSEKGPVDAVPVTMRTDIDGSQVLAEQFPPYILPPITSVGSDLPADLSKDTIKQAKQNSQQSSFTPQDPGMALDLPGSTGPSTSSTNPQPVASVPLSSNPSPNFDVDPSLSWSSYKDDQSSESTEMLKLTDWATQQSCQPQAAANSKFQARGESCTAPPQISVPEKESVPKQESVPEQESVPRQESVPPKQDDRRMKICPQDIITLCCEDKGDFFFKWFPKRCKKYSKGAEGCTDVSTVYCCSAYDYLFKHGLACDHPPTLTPWLDIDRNTQTIQTGPGEPPI